MKIVKNYIYSSLYQLFLIIVPFVTIPYISRVLGAELIGVNSYTSTIISYFVLFANLGTMVYGNRTIAYYRDSVQQRSQKFWEIIVLKILVSFLVYLLFIPFVSLYPKYQLVFWIQSVHILAAAIDISWLFDGLEDFKRTVTRNFIVKLISIALIFIFVKKTRDFNKYVLITVGAALVGNLTLWSYLRHYVVKVPFKKLKFGVHFSSIFSLFVPQIASIVFVTLNKVLLGTLSSMSQTGYFDNADKIVRILLALVSSVGVVIFPKVANAFKNKETKKVEELTKLTFNAVNIIVIPMVVGIISISDIFSDIFFGVEFSGINIVLSILAIELLFMGYSSVLGGQYLIATGQSKYLSLSVICGLIVTGLISIVLIPNYGAIGAAMSSGVGEFTIVLVETMCIRKQLNFWDLFRDVPRYMMASFLMFLVILLLKNCSVSPYLDLFLRISIGGAIYIIGLLLLKPQFVKEVLIKIKMFKKISKL